MESILFLKEIRKKGNVYKDIWTNILFQYESNGRPIQLTVPYGIHPSTYHKIVVYGVELFALISKDYFMVKDKMKLIITKKTEDFVPTAIIAKRNRPRKIKEEIKKEEFIEEVIILESEKRIPNETLPLLFVESETQPPELPITKPKIKKKVVEVLQIHIDIINHLNECAGTAYQFETKTTLDLINNKLKEGYTFENFKHVIEVKSTKWLNTKYQDYLTPSTLFGNKFENYLNETIAVKNIKQQKAYDTVNQATDLGWATKN